MLPKMAPMTVKISICLGFFGLVQAHVMLQWFATIICLGSFSVSWNTSHPGFFSYFHVCVLLCSVAAVCHHGLFWLLLCFFVYWVQVTQFFFVFPCMCVVVLCGCCLPPWFVLAPSLFLCLLGTSHPGFCISMYVCCCALWLLFATMICFDPSLFY